MISTPISEANKLAFIKKGKAKESEFAKLFSDAIFSTKEEDMKDHVDVKVTIGIDVKSLKRIRRNDESTNENIHWVELKGITGFKGWLYGKADFFAFELDDYWIVVAKEDLQKLISEKCKEKIRVERPELYKLYQRKDRKDLVTLVKSLDLIYISTRLIKK